MALNGLIDNEAYPPSSYLLSRATGQILHYSRDRSRTIRIPWRLRDLYSAGMKIQREREQNQLPSLSDQELAAKLLVRPERWASAVQSHGASQVADLFASPGEPAIFSAEDEHLDRLRSMLSGGQNRHSAAGPADRRQ